MLSRCLGTNRDGSPCSAAPLESGWCQWHDPALAKERDRWRREGGKARSNRARAAKSLPDGVMTPVELQGLLGVAIKGVQSGEMEAGPANAIANLARAYAGLFGPASFDERLAALEREDGRTA